MRLWITHGLSFVFHNRPVDKPVDNVENPCGNPVRKGVKNLNMTDVLWKTRCFGNKTASSGYGEPLKTLKHHILCSFHICLSNILCFDRI